MAAASGRLRTTGLEDLVCHSFPGQEYVSYTFFPDTCVQHGAAGTLLSKIIQQFILLRGNRLLDSLTGSGSKLSPSPLEGDPRRLPLLTPFPLK